MLITESLRLSGGKGLGTGSSELGFSGCCELTGIDEEVHEAMCKVVEELETDDEACCVAQLSFSWLSHLHCDPPFSLNLIRNLIRWSRRSESSE